MCEIWSGVVEIRGMWIFRGGRSPLLRGVTCDLRCPSSNLAELFQSKVMCENLVRIGWAFQELSCPQTNIQKKKISAAAETPYYGGYMWLAMPIFELGWAIPVKGHVWKFGLDWFKSAVCEFSGGQKSPIRGGYMCSAMPIFELCRAIPVKSHAWKFGSDWLSLSRVIVSTNKHTSKHSKKNFGGRNPLFGGLHVACDAHFRTRMSYSSQKSCVKIWSVLEIGDMWIFRGGAEAPY